MSINYDLEMDFLSQIGFSIVPGSLFPVTETLCGQTT